MSRYNIGAYSKYYANSVIKPLIQFVISAWSPLTPHKLVADYIFQSDMVIHSCLQMREGHYQNNPVLHYEANLDKHDLLRGPLAAVHPFELAFTEDFRDLYHSHTYLETQKQNLWALFNEFIIYLQKSCSQVHIEDVDPIKAHRAFIRFIIKEIDNLLAKKPDQTLDAYTQSLQHLRQITVTHSARFFAQSDFTPKYPALPQNKQLAIAELFCQRRYASVIDYFDEHQLWETQHLKIPQAWELLKVVATIRNKPQKSKYMHAIIEKIAYGLYKPIQQWQAQTLLQRLLKTDWADILDALLTRYPMTIDKRFDIFQMDEVKPRMLDVLIKHGAGRYTVPCLSYFN